MFSKVLLIMSVLAYVTINVMNGMDSDDGYASYDPEDDSHVGVYHPINEEATYWQRLSEKILDKFIEERHDFERKVENLETEMLQTESEPSIFNHQRERYVRMTKKLSGMINSLSEKVNANPDSKVTWITNVDIRLICRDFAELDAPTDVQLSVKRDTIRNDPTDEIKVSIKNNRYPNYSVRVNADTKISEILDASSGILNVLNDILSDPKYEKYNGDINNYKAMLKRQLDQVKQEFQEAEKEYFENQKLIQEHIKVAEARYYY